MVETRGTFERNLNQLLEEILSLGNMVETAVIDSIIALRNRDNKEARRIMDDDRLINEKRYEIESKTLIQMATQQPMAGDLRLLAAILEINTELERMGDYAKGIARISLLLGDEDVDIPTENLQRMAEIGLDMLRRALKAFVDKDVETARSIPVEDDEVDALYNLVFQGLIDQMVDDPGTLDRTNYLIWAAHNLERMADRVTNICERIIFVYTGEMRELDTTYDEIELDTD